MKAVIVFELEHDPSGERALPDVVACLREHVLGELEPCLAAVRAVHLAIPPDVDRVLAVFTRTDTTT